MHRPPPKNGLNCSKGNSLCRSRRIVLSQLLINAGLGQAWLGCQFAKERLHFVVKVDSKERGARVLLAQTQVLALRPRVLSPATIYIVLRAGLCLGVNLLFLAPVPGPLVDLCPGQRQVLCDSRDVLRRPVCIALKLRFKQINLLVRQPPSQLSVLKAQRPSPF